MSRPAWGAQRRDGFSLSSLQRISSATTIYSATKVFILQLKQKKGVRGSTAKTTNKTICNQSPLNNPLIQFTLKSTKSLLNNKSWSGWQFGSERDGISRCHFWRLVPSGPIYYRHLTQSKPNSAPRREQRTGKLPHPLVGRNNNNNNKIHVDSKIMTLSTVH